MRKFPSPSAIRGIEPTALIALPLSYMAPNLKTHIQRSKYEKPSHEKSWKLTPQDSNLHPINVQCLNTLTVHPLHLRYTNKKEGFKK